MPSKKSHRTSIKNAEYNKPIASRAKTLFKNSLDLIEENKDQDKIQKSYKQAISALDKASQKGVIHKNNVSRKKSKLAKKLNSK
mgnify:CR=1 FL=1|tara:strand:- start:708 stop:959 length:252 start_codon:yes stop_codon:yes gene_type:complete